LDVPKLNAVMACFYPKEKEIDFVWVDKGLLLVYAFNNCNAWMQNKKDLHKLLIKIASTMTY